MSTLGRVRSQNAKGTNSPPPPTRLPVTLRATPSSKEIPRKGPKGSKRTSDKKRPRESKKSESFLDDIFNTVKPVLHGAKKYGKAIAELVSLIGFLKRGNLLTNGESDGLPQEIPFDFAELKGGTQYPTIRLYIIPVDINTVAATMYNTVTTITAVSLAGFSDLALIFSEYRVIGGQIDLYAFKVGGTENSTTASVICDSGFAEINYVDAAPITTYTEAVCNDTKKPFSLYRHPYSTEWKPQVWTPVFEKLPDQEWLPVSPGNTALLYWKPFMHANQVDSTQTRAGLLTGHLDIQFRGEDEV